MTEYDTSAEKDEFNMIHMQEFANPSCEEFFIQTSAFDAIDLSRQLVLPCPIGVQESRQKIR